VNAHTKTVNAGAQNSELPFTPTEKNRERTEKRRARRSKKPVVEPMLPGIESPPADTPDRSPVAYTFTTTGGPWRMTEHQRDKLRDEFVFIHVDTELAGLAAWTDANPKIKPAAMWGWLRKCLARKQTERPLSTAAYYADGFQHSELPTDPTLEELNEIFPIEEAQNAD